MRKVSEDRENCRKTTVNLLKFYFRTNLCKIDSNLLVIAKVTPIIWVCPKCIACVYFYITTDLGDDAFELPLPMWYVSLYFKLTAYKNKWYLIFRKATDRLEKSHRIFDCRHIPTGNNCVHICFHLCCIVAGSRWIFVCIVNY